MARIRIKASKKEGSLLGVLLGPSNNTLLVLALDGGEIVTVEANECVALCA